MSRLDLIAAVRATAHGSHEWTAAVKALGCFARLTEAAPVPPPRRSTGLNSGELIYRMSASHVFDKDRAAIRARIPYANHSLIIEWLKTELKNRKAAEKATA